MRRIIVTALCGLFIGGCTTFREIAVHEKTLENGLRVIVKEDHRSPVVVSQVWYKVGSVDEPEGLTGISHALEHMMFKGTSRLKPNEFSRIIAENGGRENAFTSYDYTGFYQQLEKSRLPVSFELEADRMHNLLLAPEEFSKEIQVVMEERRLRTEDQPEALLGEKFMATAYQVHYYKNPVIGRMRDLEHMTAAELRRWYGRYYAPNNATLVVVGDVAPQAVFTLADKYFGRVPRRTVDATSVPAEPAQNGERRVRVAVPAEVPHMVLGYHVPALTPENSWEPYALAVAAGVLDGGEAARFARELVRERKIATAVDVDYSPISRAPTLFVLDGTPARGRSVEELERALRAQVARLREELVSAEELQRVKAQVTASDVYARDSVHYQATRLGQFASVGLDWRVGEQYVERIRAVTAEQVRAVARNYFIDTNLTVGVLDPLPMRPGQKRPAPAGGSHVR
jgi:zinc protease